MRASLMTTRALLLLLNCLVIIELMTHLMLIEVCGANSMSSDHHFPGGRDRFLHENDHDDVIRRKMQAFKESLSSPPSSLISPSPTFSPPPVFFFLTVLYIEIDTRNDTYHFF